MSGVSYHRYSGEQTLVMIEGIADLYDQIRSEYAERHDIFSRQSFVTRTECQAQKAGFEFVAVTSHDRLAGFSFGYPILPGAWWADCTPPPQEVLGSSKFAVIELDVRKEYRGQGMGKGLLDMLLSGRGEDFATLACLTNSPAQAMYVRWGWYKVATFEEPPPMDAMVIPLNN